ncbi:hypothetical protein BpHYR1_022227 [Brachionus plicatilis]|uniref:Uncharacterized protein n=1 Tax=Brachionus plicatilis TaxID=10195 RepID=A0A3M7QK45_BRAPC|nr:hypothetical protein BpHYR1_022227 [Brachionus plicatilis]
MKYKDLCPNFLSSTLSMRMYCCNCYHTISSFFQNLVGFLFNLFFPYLLLVEGLFNLSGYDELLNLYLSFSSELLKLINISQNDGNFKAPKIKHSRSIVTLCCSPSAPTWVLSQCKEYDLNCY